MSYFDEELEKELSESSINFEKLKSDAHDNFVSIINKTLPFSGSKISWNSFPNSMSYARSEYDQAFRAISEKLKALRIPEIVFIGDALTESAYKTSTNDFETTMAIFAGIPQHTYFFSDNLSFIGCISSEGEINFSEILS
ncbi:hypothetical protein [Pseudomonas glycinae]|uniref:hypothetical protein n=1 Tax=Pseudomonas glycinae TaxID=1785145 RepID=UPI002B1E28AA|nr:hypothetical protein [Pseudomonas glycinae]